MVNRVVDLDRLQDETMGLARQIAQMDAFAIRHRLPDHRPGGPDEGAPQVPMNSTSSPRVGFIGLGSQGGPMARRIIEAGYPVTLWARRLMNVARA
jgi:phosphoglycerate dehydrogenase-like enzyme